MPAALPRPLPGECLPYFERYIALVPDGDIVQLLAAQLPALRTALTGLSSERAGFRYAPGKWSVREIIGHLIDTERVFGLRALWFARGGAEPLPPFEQDLFAAAAHHDSCPADELVTEFSLLRESHLLMFRHLDAKAWSHTGVASGHAMSVRAAAFIMAGHIYHHATLLRDHYGIPLALGDGGMR